MKKRGEKLEKHYQQSFEYWLELVPQRPQYLVLCNFDEFWIYDNESASQLAKLHTQLDQLVCKAYGIKANDYPLKFLLELNFEVANRESQGLSVVTPG